MGGGKGKEGEGEGEEESRPILKASSSSSRQDTKENDAEGVANPAEEGKEERRGLLREAATRMVRRLKESVAMLERGGGGEDGDEDDTEDEKNRRNRNRLRKAKKSDAVGNGGGDKKAMVGANLLQNKNAFSLRNFPTFLKGRREQQTWLQQLRRQRRRRWRRQRWAEGVRQDQQDAAHQHFLPSPGKKKTISSTYCTLTNIISSGRLRGHPGPNIIRPPRCVRHRTRDNHAAIPGGGRRVAHRVIRK